MADEKKRYYWLKLKKDFFKRHDVQIIESMPNGKDYVLFYLKMLVESVDHEGKLRFNDTIPYNEHMISTITNTNIDVVKSAMKVFTDLKMIEVLDDETIFMSEVKKMLGTETYWAEQKRKQRELGQCPTIVQLSPENVQSMSNVSNQEIDIEIELDKDKDLKQEVEGGEKTEKDIFQFFNNNIGPIAPFQAEMIGTYLDDGMKPDLIIEILKDSIGKDNKWSWALTVIKNNCSNQVFTIEQYNAEKVKKSNQKINSKQNQNSNQNSKSKKSDNIFLDILKEMEGGDHSEC